MTSFLFSETVDEEIPEIPEKLPVGYRFNPSEKELFAYYLPLFLQCYYSSNQRFDIIDRMPIARIDLCEVEPSDLPGHSKIKSVDQEWYFFTRRRIYSDKDKRTYKRSTNTGNWKSTGKPTKFGHLGQRITLSFQNGSSDKTDTPFLIYEYQISPTSDLPNPDNFVLIKVMFQNQKKKKTQGSKRRNRSSTSEQNQKKKTKRSKTKFSFVSTSEMVNTPVSDRSIPCGLQNQNITGSDITLSCSSLENQDLAVGDTTATISLECQNAMSCYDMAPNQITQNYNSSPHNQNTSSQYHNSSLQNQNTLFQYHNSSSQNQNTPSQQYQNYELMNSCQVISHTNLNQVIPSMEITAISTYVDEPQTSLQPLQNNYGEPKSSQQDFSWPNQSSLLGFQEGECSSKLALPDLDLENHDDSSQLNCLLSSFFQDTNPSSTMEQGEHSAPMATPYTQNLITYEKHTSSSMAYNSGSYKPNEVGNMPVPQESCHESQHCLSLADFSEEDGEEVTSPDMVIEEWELFLELQSILNSPVQQPLGTEETTISGGCVSTMAPS